MLNKTRNLADFIVLSKERYNYPDRPPKKIAEEDIVVYTPTKATDIEAGETTNSIEKVESILYASDFDGDGFRYVLGGLKSFKEPNAARRVAEKMGEEGKVTIWQCVIPNGAEYYVADWCGKEGAVFVSSQLRYEEAVERVNEKGFYYIVNTRGQYYDTYHTYFRTLKQAKDSMHLFSDDWGGPGTGEIYFQPFGYEKQKVVRGAVSEFIYKSLPPVLVCKGNGLDEKGKVIFSYPNDKKKVKEDENN